MALATILGFQFFIVIILLVIPDLPAEADREIILESWGPDSLNQCLTKYREVDQESIKVWMGYVMHLLTVKFDELSMHRSSHSIINHLNSVLEYVTHHKEYCSVGRLYSQDHLSTSPCDMVKYSTTSYMQWRISVHSDFGIHIILITSELQYSPGCKYGSIVVKDVSNKTFHRSSVVKSERFCGRMSMEDLYTEHSNAELNVDGRRLLFGYSASMSAEYQVRYKGSIRRFTSNSACMKSGVNVNIRPSLLLFQHTFLEYFWYISSHFRYETFTINDSLKENTALANEKYSRYPSIVHPNLMMEMYVCSTDQSSTQVYPGVLNRYWARRRVEPHTVYTCNITERQTLDLSFHIHVTILTVCHIDEDVQLNMTFNMNAHSATNISTTISPSQYLLSDSVLQTTNNIAHGVLASYFSIVTFKSFSAKTANYITTVKRSKVQTHDISLQKHERLLSAEGK